MVVILLLFWTLLHQIFILPVHALSECSSAYLLVEDKPPSRKSSCPLFEILAGSSLSDCILRTCNLGLNLLNVGPNGACELRNCDYYEQGDMELVGVNGLWDVYILRLPALPTPGVQPPTSASPSNPSYTETTTGTTRRAFPVITSAAAGDAVRCGLAIYVSMVAVAVSTAIRKTGWGN